MGRVLVVGGGVTGMQSSLDLANMGHQVYLVEKERELGGNLKNLDRIFPMNDKATEFLSNFTEKVQTHTSILVLKNSTICKLEEESHGFRVTINSGKKPEPLDVDAIVLTTGFSPYDPTEKTEYGYTRHRDCVTSIDLERMMKEGKLVRPSNSEKPRSVTFIQCVGFRDAKANEYCSSFCCTQTVKETLLIKSQYPDTEVTVMYMDIRTPFTYENLYLDARQAGVKFIRGRPAGIYENKGKLLIDCEDTLTSEPRSIESDLVVLSVGATPPPETKKLSQILGISTDDMGFFKVQNRSSRTEANLIFAAGAACGPKDIDYCLSQASAAASEINKLLRGKRVADK